MPTSSHLYPFQVGNSTYLAAAGILQGQPPTETSVIYEAVTIDPQNTDYYNRLQQSCTIVMHKYTVQVFMLIMLAMLQNYPRYLIISSLKQ